MKNILTTAIVLVAVGVGMESSAQNIRTAYFMEQSTMRSRMNPAFRPTRGYVNIPVIGSLGVEYNSNALTLDNILYQNPNGSGLVTFLDSDINGDKLISDLKKRNNLNVDIAMNVAGVGYYSGKGFWTFDIDVKENTALTLPKGLFEYAKIGSVDGRAYDLKDILVNTNGYTEFAVGYSRPYNDKLMLGAKVKFLVGIVSAKMKYDKLYIKMTGDSWEIDASGRLDMNANGITVGMKTDEEDGSKYMDFEEIDANYGGPSGYGVGVDLGATYKLMDNLMLSAAITDLGFISWSSKNSVSGQSNDYYSFSGIDVDGGDFNDGNFDKLLRFNKLKSKGRSTRLNTTLNLGGEYSILDNKVSFGLLSSTIFRPTSTMSELTASAMYRPIDWFTGTFSYSMMHSNFQTYGLALNFSTSWINFFVGSDYMLGKVSKQFVPIKQKAASLYFGLAIPLARTKTI